MSEYELDCGGSIGSNGSAAGNQFMKLMIQADTQAKNLKRVWADHLIENGIVMAHPNDGWVDRQNQIFSPCYPQFKTKSPEIGDRLALGWPPKDKNTHQFYCIVGVIEVIENRLYIGEANKYKYRYEVLGDVRHLSDPVPENKS